MLPDAHTALFSEALAIALDIDRRLPASRWSTTRLVFRRQVAVRCAVLDGRACATLAPAVAGAALNIVQPIAHTASARATVCSLAPEAAVNGPATRVQGPRELTMDCDKSSDSVDVGDEAPVDDAVALADRVSRLLQSGARALDAAPSTRPLFPVDGEAATPIR
ncbi:MAG: hypothetical protein H0W72_10755 [Planctomycetes bacterium]|nr:hypothetical protein [Planctomycetota bacterium]